MTKVCKFWKKVTFQIEKVKKVTENFEKTPFVTKVCKFWKKVTFQIEKVTENFEKTPFATKVREFWNSNLLFFN